MIDLVLGAVRATHIANLSAKLANTLGELCPTGHFARGPGADVSATAVQFDAACHCLDVLFVQTGRGAVFALNGAPVARLNIVLIFFVGHGYMFYGFVFW